MKQRYGPASRRRHTSTPERWRKIIRKRKMRRLRKRLLIAVPALAVVIVALILLFGSQNWRDASTPKDVNAGTASSGKTQVQAPSSESASPLPTATAAPFDYDEAYVRAVNGEITGPDVSYDFSGVDPALLERWPRARVGYIPILKKANTTENIIAITVDDCNQGENFRAIVQCAIDNDAKLTIFPIGENLERAAVAATLRLAYANGMEIGNHTYTHSGLFHYGQDHMRDEIWTQAQKVNETLGVNYTQRFFRPRGGDERECQRLHGYLHQLNYRGLAMWSMSGSANDVDKLYNDLAPGNIYLFHTTDKDLERLRQFIPGAVTRGYRLVTMSEMFGFPENEIGEYSAQSIAPELQSFKLVPTMLQRNDYSRAVAVVQRRLIELGWMSGEATGVYGKQTMLAIGFFQMALGQTPNGIADMGLQKTLFSDAAPRGSFEQVQAFCRKLGKAELKSLPGS